MVLGGVEVVCGLEVASVVEVRVSLEVLEAV